ncbi:MAG: putative (di)nucleoside polyphosphate hydrolase [Alphaproteobacteria bacterium]|jgi:putative (di)nucleoside polyphosphate hydrolase
MTFLPYMRIKQQQMVNKMLEFKDRPYRPCAGICLMNKANHIFVGQRIDSSQDAWQMPQGGIDEGETTFKAAMREMLEEIGTDKAHLVAELAKPLDYDLPADLADKMWHGQYRGQRQYWFLMQFTGTDNDINLATEHPEFSAYKWVNPQKLPSLAISFKRDIYQSIITEFAPYFTIEQT